LSGVAVLAPAGHDPVVVPGDQGPPALTPQRSLTWLWVVVAAGAATAADGCPTEYLIATHGGSVTAPVIFIA